jgi:Gram-negative bacterial TonB protein C-terminal/Caspase domain
MKTMMIVGALFVASVVARAQPAGASRGVIGAQQIPATADSFAKLRAGRNFALVIGTDEYVNGWPGLQNPVRDATAVAKEIEANYGYQVDLVINPIQDAIKLKLRDYAQKKFQPDDSLFIFIAGHGKFDELTKEGFLAFKDSRLDDATGDTYVSHAYLRKLVDLIQVKRILMVIDACFSGTIDDQVASRGADDFKYPEASKAEIVMRKSGLKTRLFLTSGGKEYVPDGSPGANSPFASQILGVLRTYGASAGGLLTFDDLRQQAEKVRGSSPQSGQWGQSERGGDYWFVTAPLLQSAPRVKVGANVMTAKLISKVAPPYPALAKSARVQGTVRFSAIIGKDGHIADLTLISGHPLLAKDSTQDALKQWAYQPTLLNGEPVEVVTEIDVTFGLSN